MRLEQASNSVAAGRMTVIAPPVDGAAADGRSFADWLANAGDGVSDERARPFSNGTMRAAAQRFDADGLLATGMVPAAEAADVKVQADADAVPFAPATVVGPAVAPKPAPAMNEALPSPPTPTPTPAPSAPGQDGGVPATTVTPLPVTAATHRTVPVARAGMAMPAVAARSTRFTAIASEPASTVRRARLPAAAAVQVTLTDAEAGVTVAVAGAVAREEEAGVQQAVRRLLARHGLTLGDMRFVRRIGGGRREGER